MFVVWCSEVCRELNWTFNFFFSPKPPPAKRFEQCSRDYLLDEDEEEEEDLAKQVAAMKASGKVLLDGVEYKVESLTPNSSHSATPPRVCATPPSYNTPPPSYGGMSGYVTLHFHI